MDEKDRPIRFEDGEMEPGNKKGNYQDVPIIVFPLGK